jgi:hypothetical protein
MKSSDDKQGVLIESGVDNAATPGREISATPNGA